MKKVNIIEMILLFVAIVGSLWSIPYILMTIRALTGSEPLEALIPIAVGSLGFIPAVVSIVLLVQINKKNKK